MPVELLIGIVLASVVVNLTLLLWLSRADHVKVHWSRPVRSAVDSVLARPPEADAQPVRRRALYVAEQASLHGPVPAPVPGPMPASPNPAPSASPSWGPHAPLAEMLPPDLAEFVSRPASIAPHPNGFDRTAFGDGAGLTEPPAQRPDEGESRIMAHVPATRHEGSTGLPMDALTSLESAEGWSRIMAIENARLLRYRRPVAVVVAEVEGLRQLSERLGDEPVDRLLPVIADAFRREARTSDWVARVGPSRFAVFLPETNEIQANNYVERIRIACEPGLGSAAVPLRLAIGWSSPTASSDLEFAVLRAEERMHADRRRAGRAIQPPRGDPARVVSLPPAGGDASDELGTAAVPPAETGRSGEWIRSQTGPENPVQAQSGDVSRGKGRLDPAGSTSGSVGRTDV